MAEKRALIAAVLCTVGASEFFSQDLEDMDLEDTPKKPRNASGVNRTVKNIPPNQNKTSSNNGNGNNNGNGLSPSDWYQKGMNDALLGEEVKYSKVQPYMDGYFAGEKEKKLNEIEQDIEF